MSGIPTPTEVAAANQARELQERNTARLFELTMACANTYMGRGCVSFTPPAELAPNIDGVKAKMTGWALYASTDGKLYIGTAADVAVVQKRDAQADVPEPVAMPCTTSLPVKGDEPAGPCGTAMVPPVTIPPPAASRTFDLFPVERSKGRLVQVTPNEVFAKLLVTPVEACSVGGANLIRSFGFHALIETAHIAFSSHYGLDLSPDDIWVTITQGLARLINSDPERYRDKFVTHQGKSKIQIRRDQFLLGSPNNDWPGCFSEFSAALKDVIGATHHGHLISDFTTTGPIQRATSEVVLMDTVQSYFAYRVNTMCGIPFVTLRGTENDWLKLTQKVYGLTRFGDLDWWLNDLREIVDQLLASARGNFNKDFWNSLYKSNSESGSTKMTGWLLKLLPLVGPKDKPKERNPLLGHANTQPHRRGESRWRDEAEIDSHEPHVYSSQLPGSLSTVPFEWNYLGDVLDYQFVAGIVGFAQNEDDFAVRPQMGWAVRPAPKPKS